VRIERARDTSPVSASCSLLSAGARAARHLHARRPAPIARSPGGRQIAHHDRRRSVDRASPSQDSGAQHHAQERDRTLPHGMDFTRPATFRGGVESTDRYLTGT
jgi:hypothetical protein